MENDYIKVNVNDYINAGLKNGMLVPLEAEKYLRILARQGIEGEQIISWSVDKDGKAIQEKISIVSIDKTTNKPGWVALKVDENGQEIVDENGHINEWIIDDSTFQKKYEVDENMEGVFKPKGRTQLFVQISDNVILDQFGVEMKIANGGYINITNANDMYGISERDFNDTYRIINEERIRKI